MIFKIILFFAGITILVCNKQMAQAASLYNEGLYGSYYSLLYNRLILIAGGVLTLSVLFFDAFVWED